MEDNLKKNGNNLNKKWKQPKNTNKSSLVTF